jgi:hypothetical protein
MWKIVCEACNQCFESFRNKQGLCQDCSKLRKELSRQSRSTNSYVYTNIPGRTQHRDMAETVLGRTLDINEVVHHLDNNPQNNCYGNLIVMNKGDHGRLHSYLQTQRVIIEKSMNENSENCWKALIVPKTTTWLETTGVNVIKLWELGNQQPSCLTAEGSETIPTGK